MQHTEQKITFEHWNYKRLYDLLLLAFETEALDEHNKFRQVHGSQPMRLNREMCDEAAAYAKIIAQSGNMKHSTKEQRKGQGENLSMGCSSNKGGQTTTEAVDNW